MGKSVENKGVKNRIVSAAWQLFHERGYNGTTVDDIIELSETSKGSFYYYFNTKDELLNTLSLILDDYYEELDSTMDPEMNSFDKLLYLNYKMHEMMEDRISIDLLASLYSTQLVSQGQRNLLDHNRNYYKLITRIVEEGLVDYVAMDVKNSRENYGRTIGIEGYDTRNVEKSVGYLLSGAVDYEFRTTVVREFHQRSDFEAIGRWIKGAKRYYLQQFQDSGDLIRPGLHAYNDNIMRQALDVVKAYVPSAELRGI